MARELTWRRRSGVNFEGGENLASGWRNEWCLLASVNPGETVTRVILDGHLWRQFQTAGGTETTLFLDMYVGIVLLGSSFTSPPINPGEDFANNSWMWWQFVGWSRIDPGFFNDDSYQRRLLHIDCKAQRISPSMGTASGKVWFIVSYTRPDILVTTGWNMPFGASVGVLAPIGG